MGELYESSIVVGSAALGLDNGNQSADSTASSASLGRRFTFNVGIL
jgi:hypothetical protein